MACIARSIWRLCTPASDSMWVNWVRLNLLSKNQFWVAKVPWSCSWSWRKILKLRDRVRPFLSLKVGNGLHTSLWFDAWMPRGPICSSPSARVIYDSGLPKDALVSTIISGTRWSWPLANSHELIDLKRETDNLPPPNIRCNDLLMWDGVKKEFTMRSAWNSLRESHPHVPWYKVIWFKFSIPSHAFILWLAVRKKLATQDRLLSFGLLSSMSCLFCQTPLEDHDHLFFDCPYTFRVWHTLMQDCGLPISSRSWDATVAWMSSTCTGLSLASTLARLSLAASVYLLWKERNRRKHDNVSMDVHSMIRSIKHVVCLRLLSSRGFPNTAQNRHLIHHWKLLPTLLQG